MIIKTISLLIPFLFISIQNFCQIEIDWGNIYDGPAGFIDDASDFIVDAYNNVYTTGSTYNDSENGYDAILIKYNSNGDKLWEATYSYESGDDKAQKISIINNFIYLTCTSSNKLLLVKFDSDGNFLNENLLKSGSFFHRVETISISESLYIKTSYVENSIDRFELIKCDLSCNVDWTYDYDLYSIAMDIEIDSNGNILIAGSKGYMYIFEDEIYWGNSLLLKISPDGNLIWETEIESNPNPEELVIIQSISIDNQNNIYAVSNNIIISKIDNSGDLVWNNEFVHSEYEGNTIQNIKCNDNKIFMNGYSHTNGNSPNTLTICYNSLGDIEWYKNYFTVPEYSGISVSSLNIDNNGNIFSSAFKHDVGGRHDVYLVGYDLSGNELCSFVYNSTGINSECIENAIIKNNKIYLLVNSSQDIMTLKLNNPYASVESYNENDLRIFPNPTNRMINFDFANSNIQKITITDILGKESIEKLNILNNDQADLSAFESGVYIISIHSDNKIFTSKIIKI